MARKIIEIPPADIAKVGSAMPHSDSSARLRQPSACTKPTPKNSVQSPGNSRITPAMIIRTVSAVERLDAGDDGSGQRPLTTIPDLAGIRGAFGQRG